MNDYPVSTRLYKGKVRVRVIGILIENNKLLMLKHRGIGTKGFLWIPPGGGVEFNESSETALIKEFREETGLEVEVQRFICVNEYMDREYHAVELVFQVKKTGGSLILGKDPEVPAQEQILDDVKWFTFAEMDAMDKNTVHNIFSNLESSKNILEMRGFYNFVNIST